MNKSTKSQGVIRYYWNHAKKYPRWLFGVLVSLPITILVGDYLPPIILAIVLSRLAQHDYSSSIWQSFGKFIVLFILLKMMALLCWRVVDYFVWRLEANVQRDISEEVFAHMLDETADFHANNFTGTLVSQANKLMAGYIRMADTTIFQAYALASGLIITGLLLFTRASLFVVLLLVFAITYLLVAFRISRRVRMISAKHAAAESKQTGYLADAITNALAIKSFSQAEYERRRFHEATSFTKQRLMEFSRVHGRQMNTLGGLNRVLSGMALLLAIIGVMVFKANVATVFLIFSYTSSIVEQLFNFSNNGLRNYNRALGDATDMVQILGTKPAIQDPAIPEKVRIGRGEVVFSNVTFTHSGQDEAIFRRLNVALKPGEKIGLVGHSGSGKTTFTRLLLRFSDLDSGEILIDGQNISRITQADLHRFIAYVPQEPLLFHRTLQENIQYGDLSASKEKVIEVAKMAHAEEFIDQLPQKYDTLVGERGVKLSGGQRQRVAIARAMLKNAPILVLDEATSALDSESEVLIQDALWKLMEGRTAIVIAHRLSTIQKMDRIIVLDDGQIVEEGTHKELLAKNGTYAKLWAHQSGGFIEE